MAFEPSGKVFEVSKVDPDLIAEFKELTEQAAEYRRRSYGSRSHQKQLDDEGRSYFSLLSSHLLLIHHMVKRHPELEDQYREWRLRYHTFTSD